MSDDSCLRGRGFTSRRHILDGHFSHWFVVKNVLVCLKRPKIKEKEAGDGPFFQKNLRRFKADSWNTMKQIWLTDILSKLIIFEYAPKLKNILLERAVTHIKVSILKIPFYLRHVLYISFTCWITNDSQSQKGPKLGLENGLNLCNMV